MIQFLSTPPVPSFLTSVYAIPAHNPPIKATIAADDNKPATPGFKINAQPARATPRKDTCTHVIFSFNIQTANNAEKKGDILLSIVASERSIWSTE